MRAFAGIEFEKDLKSQIASLQLKLKGEGLSGRWKHLDNFHLTLKFLGEINSEEQKAACLALKAASEAFSPFKLHITNIGYFKGQGVLRVLYLGLGGEADKLMSLQAFLDRQMEAAGFAREKRPFTPHVTIGQDIHCDYDLDKLKQLVSSFTFQEINVGRIELIKSEQIGMRRIYTPVAEFPLH